MSALSSRPLWRWLVPVAVVIVLVGGGAAANAIASAAPSLPPRTAAQLLVDLETTRVDGLSGTVVQRADLGLPALPGLGGGGSGMPDLTTLLSGTHTLRVWYSGPSSARVALLSALGETDVIANGHEVWTWSSRDNKATHRTLAAKIDKDSVGTPEPLPSGLPMTPRQAADAALAAIDPSTVVTTAGSARVAGRAAYELILAPRDSASLVAQVRMAIDATEHVPLRVQVFARGAADPAIEVAFTQISFARPGAEQFRFNPPPGATVTEESADAPAPAKPEASKPDPSKPEPSKDDAANEPTVIGSGWTAVLVARTPASDLTGGAKAGGGLGVLLRSLPAAHGTWGSGRMLTGKLFSVLLIDDGRVLVGAVSPQRLLQAAADPAAALKAGR